MPDRAREFVHHTQEHHGNEESKPPRSPPGPRPLGFAAGRRAGQLLEQGRRSHLAALEHQLDPVEPGIATVAPAQSHARQQNLTAAGPEASGAAYFPRSRDVLGYGGRILEPDLASAIGLPAGTLHLNLELLEPSNT
jgi:hypothetical protein